jgi:N-acetylglutamate synthase-like GNAT family acetyltransferase
MKIRRAIAPDARAIHALILHYAANGLLLPRSVEDVVRDIDTFIVCEESRAIVGCLSLFEYHTGLAEIRSRTHRHKASHASSPLPPRLSFSRVSASKPSAAPR